MAEMISTTYAIRANIAEYPKRVFGNGEICQWNCVLCFYQHYYCQIRIIAHLLYHSEYSISINLEL